MYYIPLEYIIKIDLFIYPCNKILFCISHSQVEYYPKTFWVWSNVALVCLRVVVLDVYITMQRRSKWPCYFELFAANYNNLLQITRQITTIILLTLKPVSLSRINFGVSVSTPHPAHRAAFTRNSIRNIVRGRGKSFILFPHKLRARTKKKWRLHTLEFSYFL